MSQAFQAHNQQLLLGRWLGAGLLLAVILAIYALSMRGGFVWDDRPLISENRLITGSAGLRPIWLPMGMKAKPVDYWPLTYTSFWIEWRLWGNHTIGYHLTSLVLHAIACIMLWRVLEQLGIPGAYLAALLFAVHPVNVESVAWISQRKNTLSMVFYLLSIYWYLRHATLERDRLWYGLSLAAFALSLLAKTSTVVLPFVLLGCIWWKRRIVTRSDLMGILPYFVIAVVLGGVAVWFQKNVGLAHHVARDDGILSRIVIAGWAVWFYLYKAVLPLKLCFVYPRWQADVAWWPSYVPLALLAAMLFVFWWYRKSWSRPWLFGASYYVLGLLPVLGFVDIYLMTYTLVADHWQYVALPAVVAGLGAALTALAATRLAPLAWGATALLVLVWSGLTFQYAAIFRDEITVWKDTLEKNPTCWVAHNNLGNLTYQPGNEQQSLRYFEEAIRLKPDDAEGQNNLGELMDSLGRTRDAVTHYEKAVRLKPEFAKARHSLALALEALGRPEDALPHYREALRIEPDSAECHYNFGGALYGLGRSDEALRVFREAVRLRPDYAQAHNNIGVILSQRGESRGAMHHFQEALRAKPEYDVARNNLNMTLRTIERERNSVAP